MHYLAAFLIGPWLLILGWAYWVFPKNMPNTRARRWFDAFALLLATCATLFCIASGFQSATVPVVEAYGRPSGAIWQQVLPALAAYGACVLVLVAATLARHVIWRKRGG